MKRGLSTSRHARLEREPSYEPDHIVVCSRKGEKAISLSCKCVALGGMFG
jgi:hypothetical protein